VKDLAADDRPREKLLRLGAGALGDNELIALVLGNGCRDLDALAVANQLLKLHGGVHALTRSTCEELARTTGVGVAKAARLVAAVELGRRTLTRAPGARVQFRSPHDAAQFLLPAFGSRPIEQFGMVLLDTKHRVLKTTLVAVGSLNTTGVEPRDVFREAILGSAAAIVVFHNHPSGDPTPSPDDVGLTRRLVAAGVLVGIDVVDHLVLGDARYCSLRDRGEL
jgi:DNA repair protein RadC